MRNRFKLLWFICALALLSGCMITPVPPTGGQAGPGMPVVSQVPVPGGYRLNTQPKMQAIHHWDVLAKDVAGRVERRLSGTHLKDQYILYVAPSGTTAFEKIFHQLLITAFVEKGISVSSTPQNAMVVSFDIELVRHASRLVRAEKGVYRSLAPGFMVKDDLPLGGNFSQTPTAEFLVDSAQVNTEAGLYTVELPETEIVITTSLTRDKMYIARTSSVYYINDPEWWHYKNKTGVHSPSLATFSIVDE